MALRRAAATTDWDAALQALDNRDSPVESQPGADDADDAIEVFRHHHAALHEAARAVLHASDGEIRTLL